jgi:hypothetical protein
MGGGKGLSRDRVWRGEEEELGAAEVQVDDFLYIIRID